MRNILFFLLIILSNFLSYKLGFRIGVKSLVDFISDYMHKIPNIHKGGLK